jgi:hypothetical protein
LGFGSATSEFTGVLARSLPTCRIVGSEFTNLQPLIFGTKYRIEEPNKNQEHQKFNQRHNQAKRSEVRHALASNNVQIRELLPTPEAPKPVENIA